MTTYGPGAKPVPPPTPTDPPPFGPRGIIAAVLILVVGFSLVLGSLVGLFLETHW